MKDTPPKNLCVNECTYKKYITSVFICVRDFIFFLHASAKKNQ